MQKALDAIAALPGLADIKDTKRVPRGFYGLCESFLEHYDHYTSTVREHMKLGNAARPGAPGGCNACYEVPVGVHAIEALVIYRKIRPWKEFPKLAQSLADLAEQQFKAIQAEHHGKDPEKVRMGGKAVQKGRLAFAKRGVPCPFLDVEKQRCRIWDVRPLVCRMHHVLSDPSWSHPTHARYTEVAAKNLRPPLRMQVALAQLDKRMILQLSPILYAGILQILQLGEGQTIPEIGEAPQRMQQDGQIVQRANRNVKHAKKYQKNKRK